MKFVTQDYYQILSVSPEASGEEIKRAYRSVRQSFRPDSMAVHSLYSPEETEAISAKIDEAFQLLSQPERAASYSRYHRNGRAGQAIPRSPEVFFGEIHDLNSSSPIESLAVAVSSETESHDEIGEESLEHEFMDDEADQLDTEDLILGDTVAELEPLLSSLEEVEEIQSVGPPTAGPANWTPSPPPQRSRGPLASSTAAARNAGVTAPCLRPVPSSINASGAAARKLAPEAIANPFARPTSSPDAIQQRNFAALPEAELEAIEMDCQGINGAYLKAVREALGLDYFYIAAHTKIGRSMLTFIEEENVEELPARVYLKGYLVHISRLLKLPENQTAERYLSNLQSN